MKYLLYQRNSLWHCAASELSGRKHALWIVQNFEVAEFSVGTCRKHHQNKVLFFLELCQLFIISINNHMCILMLWMHYKVKYYTFLFWVKIVFYSYIPFAAFQWKYHVCLQQMFLRMMEVFLNSLERCKKVLVMQFSLLYFMKFKFVFSLESETFSNVIRICIFFF